jgi:hypothetical protein
VPDEVDDFASDADSIGGGLGNQYHGGIFGSPLYGAHGLTVA